MKVALNIINLPPKPIIFWFHLNMFRVFPLISLKDIVSFNRLTLDTENNGSVRHIMEVFIYIITTVNSKKIFVSHCRPKLLTGWSIDRDFFLLTKYYETDILIIIINSLLYICRSIQGLITAVKHDNH